MTKSREEFLEKYRKGKLSQATKEEGWDVNRDAFVQLMGDAFVEVSDELARGRCGFSVCLKEVAVAHTVFNLLPRVVSMR